MRMNRIKNIIVHWSASSLTVGVETIRQWHKQKGWKDIGYHRVILHPNALKADNQKSAIWSDLVKQGRPLDLDLYLEDFERGAHTLGMNRNSIGICVIGNSQNQLHQLQKIALENTLKILIDRFDLEPKDISCHRDHNPTECPGDEIYKFVQGLKKLVVA